MSSIDRLMIQGVRAFADGHKERIDFSVPLTLIVGHNGSGKTTIIEALKYASTGIMPPGLQGAGQEVSFLHDPKLDNESVISARIQMVMHGANGAKITATRQMELNQKRGKFSFETKNGNLLIEGQGDSRSVSLNKKEMDDRIPSYLGVSPHVLDLVIFCHQDESLWPMSGAKDLKARFDKLFEIDKWVKCLAQLNMMKKDQQTKLKEHKLLEERFKIDKDRGAQVRRECDALTNEIESLEAQRIAVNDEYEDARAQFDEAEKGLSHANGLVGMLALKREQLKGKQNLLLREQQGLKELDEDTETLKDMLAKYGERMTKYDEGRDELTGQYKQLRQDIERYRASLTAADREIGSHEAQRANHEAQKVERQQLIKSLATHHDITGYNGQLDDSKADAFSERLQRMIRDSNAEVESAKQSSKAEVQGIQQQLNIMAQQQTTQANKKDNAKLAISENDVEVAKLQQEYDQLDVDEGDRAVTQTRLTDVKQRLSDAKTELQAADYAGQERVAELEVAKVDMIKKELESELQKATENMAETAKFEVIRNNITDGQQRLNTMLSAHRVRLNSVIGEQWQTSDIKAHYDSAAAGASAALLDVKQQRDDANRELEQLDEKLNSCNSKISAHEATVTTAVSAINAVVEAGPEGYHEEVEELEKARDTTKKDAEQFQMVIDYLEQCEKDAKNKNVCRTCTRMLKNSELEAMMRNIAREKSKLDKKSADADLAQVEKELKEVRAVAPQVALWDRLIKTELPALREERRRLDQQRVTIRQKLEAHEDLVADRSTALRDVESVGKTVEKIAELHANLSNDQKKLQDLNATLTTIDQHRDLKSINAERDTVNHDESVAQAKLKKYRQERENADKRIHTLELQARDMQSEVVRIDAQAKAKLEKSNRIDDLKASSLAHKTTIRDCERALEQSKLELDAAQEKLDDAYMRGAVIESELQVKANELKDSLNKLNLLQSQVQAYIDDDGPGRMERAQANARAMADKTAALQQEQAKVAQELQQIELNAQNHDEIRRNIIKNLSCREIIAGLEPLQKEIEDLSSRDAEAEKIQYENARDIWGKKKESLSGELGEQAGMISRMRNELKNKLNEFEVQYKDAALNYRKAHINAEVTTACAKDLAQYGAAMDQALMKFHSLKMDEINRIIDELWRKTYQGSDIDTIFIESDAAPEAKGTGSSKNYHYRVCMQKMNTAMDMRGRCSAGQKVLACIIIRLALAECFGVNCGLIALDEPTTNLDRDNIQALALSLAELIKLRRAQKNFQLIVITHDEEFLKFMNPATYVDHYWRVSRTNRQKSHIQQEQISYLMRH